MSSEVDPGIQLHFCQACGMSVPQADIDAGRARCDPDACAFRLHPERCPIDFGSRVVKVPGPAAADAPRPTGSGTRVLAAIALLYVVGATTFLLARELNRQPPVLDLGDTATVAQVRGISSKLDDADNQTRSALADLKSNDIRQRDDLKEVGTRLDSLNTTVRQLAKSNRTQANALEEAILEVAQRTGILKGNVDDALVELRDLRGRIEAPAKGGAPVVDDGPPSKKDDSAPRKSMKQLEEERLMGEYIVKLKDRKASEQTRYNAAVQLGDLAYEDAVTALIEAVQNDPHDLVRRAAAWSLGMHGKRAIRAIPVLIEQLGGKHEYVGYMCERALGEITKAVFGEAKSFDFDPTMSRSQRKKVMKQWQDWWKTVQPQLLPDSDGP